MTLPLLTSYLPTPPLQPPTFPAHPASPISPTPTRLPCLPTPPPHPASPPPPLHPFPTPSLTAVLTCSQDDNAPIKFHPPLKYEVRHAPEAIKEITDVAGFDPEIMYCYLEANRMGSIPTDPVMARSATMKYKLQPNKPWSDESDRLPHARITRDELRSICIDYATTAMEAEKLEEAAAV